MPFLPVSPKEINNTVDFILLTPEAYVDHPSFGHAIISRLVEAEGFSIAINSQPKSRYDYAKFKKPNIAFLVSGGVVDSMVNNYTVAKRKRHTDDYSEGGKAGARADRAVTVYCRHLKSLFPDTPIIIGGIEASLRRFAHYDYWADKVMPSILLDCGADLLVYGMGERPLLDILSLVKKGVPINSIKDVEGTAYLSDYDSLPSSVKEGFSNNSYAFCPTYEEVAGAKTAFVKAFNIQSSNNNPINSRPIVQKHGKLYVIQNTPAQPLHQKEMDRIYSLPYMREPHPQYKEGVPAIEEVKFSITSHRGCYGGCSYCALSYHQGKTITSRSKQSILDEAQLLISKPDFKGYIHDIGGPTANFRRPSCDNQEKNGVCSSNNCIGFKVCPNLVVDHSEYLDILRELRSIKGVKKVFIRSGIRYDYVMLDKNEDFFKELVEHHISGQLKVAPEHCSDKVLSLMNKPPFEVYKSFYERYKKENDKLNKEQYLVPYLISSHPGSTIKDAIELTEYLKSINYMPEQVQDFYPTPSTKSTCMYYTEINPDTMERIYVAKTHEEKKTQRALLQYRLKENASIIKDAYDSVSGKMGKSDNVNQSRKNDKAKTDNYTKAAKQNRNTDKAVIKNSIIDNKGDNYTKKTVKENKTNYKTDNYNKRVVDKYSKTDKTVNKYSKTDKAVNKYSVTDNKGDNYTKKTVNKNSNNADNYTKKAVDKYSNTDKTVNKHSVTDNNADNYIKKSVNKNSNNADNYTKKAVDKYSNTDKTVNKHSVTDNNADNYIKKSVKGNGVTDKNTQSIGKASNKQEKSHFFNHNPFPSEKQPTKARDYYNKNKKNNK